MQYTTKYSSPLGEILLSCDDKGLTGLWFVDQKYFAHNLDEHPIEKETPLLKQAKKWLDIYFAGREPDIKIPIHFIGTPFQIEVWNILLDIPYGKTVSYGEVSSLLAKKRGIKRMSSQAVGGAVGKNPISIIVPCHRVIGSSNSLTGYAGGLDKKIELLKLERGYKEEFFIPKK